MIRHAVVGLQQVMDAILPCVAPDWLIFKGSRLLKVIALPPGVMPVTSPMAHPSRPARLLTKFSQPTLFRSPDPPRAAEDAEGRAPANAGLRVVRVCPERLT